MQYTGAVKHIFTKGHIIVMVALRGPVVTVSINVT